MKLDFKSIGLIVIINFGLLWILDAVGLLAGILEWIGNKVPFTAAIPGFHIGEYLITVPPVAALIAVFAVALVVNFVAFSMAEGFENKKLWTTFLIFAVVSTVLWVAIPQILPLRFGQLAGSAQSLFTGNIPMSVLG
jgi:uncharacterized protein (DUF486 family)